MNENLPYLLFVLCSVNVIWLRFLEHHKVILNTEHSHCAFVLFS